MAQRGSEVHLMREILFKAKRVDNGEWVEGSLLQTTAVSLKSFIVPSASYTFGQWDWLEMAEVDSDTICQYTRSTDKNGNKIWENDIVEIPSEDEYFKLEWQEDTARFVMSSDSFIVDFDNYWSYEIEVIGNIFDHKELLESEEQHGK